MKFSAGTGAKAVLQTTITLIASAATAVWLWIVDRQPLALIGTALIGIACGVCLVWLIPRFVHSVCGVFGTDSIRVSFGVLLHREVFVPLKSLRTFEIWAPPLHRLFRCRTIVLRFAGGAAVLPLLSCDTAALLTETLDRRGEES